MQRFLGSMRAAKAHAKAYNVSLFKQQIRISVDNLLELTPYRKVCWKRPFLRSVTQEMN